MGPCIPELFILVAHVNPRRPSKSIRELSDQGGGDFLDAQRKFRKAQGGENEKERKDKGVLPMHQARVRVYLPHQEEFRQPL